jgi:hypothetical protein
MSSNGGGGAASPGFSFAAALRWPDVALGVLLASATVIYLATLPLNVVTPPDEAHALHQAKRLLDGEVLYRDLFDLATPLWTYLMACLFWLFGTTLATARATVAVVHGATVLGLFLVCRGIGVRRAVAIVAAAAPIIVCQPVYPVANRHWLVTLMCMALLFWCLPARRRAVWSLIAGIIVGIIVATHQQRGASMGLGVFAFMLVEALLQARYGNAEPVSALARRIAAFAVGVIAVVGTILAGAVISAGLEPVWYALVVHPLTNYYGTLSSTWARAGPYIARSTFPLFLKYLPVILVLVLGRLLFLIWYGRNPAQARLLALLALFCAFAIVSIAYYPDVIHVAFIAPLFFVAIAEALEWLLRALPRRLAAPAAWIAAAAILVASGNRLAQRWNDERDWFNEERATAFGRANFSFGFVGLYDRLDRLLGDVPSRTLYVHPISGFTYLLLGARNPTRFEFMQAGGYNTLDHGREVIEALDGQEVPYVFFALRPRPSDPVVQFIRKHYEPLEGSWTPETIWKRREAAAGGFDAKERAQARRGDGP